MSLILPSVDYRVPAVDWVWWLCDTPTMTQITELQVHSKQLQVQLNSPGKATGWVHLLDEAAEAIIPHQTALRLDRNGETVWSGPIWQITDQSAASTGQEEGQDQCQITAMGWFNTLGGNSGENGRQLHTGAEFAAMLTTPNGVLWQAQNGTYVCPGVDTAVQLSYSATLVPTTTDAVIIFDLLNRANIDAPTLITAGNVFGSPVQRNLTLQRFQQVGQEISQLVNVEAGVDFHIDPVTRQMHLYGPGASSSPSVPNGRGVDRGGGVVFTYPGNCVQANKSQDGTQTTNRMEAIGDYAVGREDDIVSQQQNGLLEANEQLSDVVDPNILVAYAQAEVAVKSQPWTIITMTPRGLISDDYTKGPGVPRPYDDFDLGDIIYARVDRGRFQVGTSGAPQATRMFGWTLTIDDDGVERIAQIMTTYQGTGI